MHASDHPDRPGLALLIRLGGVAGFAFMAAFIKLASESGIHLAEIIFWRQFITLPLILGWVMLHDGLATLGTQRPKTHAVRGAYGLVGMLLNFGGVILLPLSESVTLNFTSPIWAVVLSMVLLREKVGIWRWSAVIMGFGGIVLIAQPGSGEFPLYGALVAIGGAFMIALISIQIRDLGRTEKPVTIVFWFSAISTLVSLPFLPFVYEPHTPHQWLLLLGIGLAGTCGQLLVTAALRFGAVSSVIVMDYSSLIWATLLGWLIWDRLPTPYTWIGAPLVVGAGLLIAWREHFLGKRASVTKLND